MPGAERISDAELAKRRAEQPLKSKAEQKPADEGLFSDQSKQADLFDPAIVSRSPWRRVERGWRHTGNGAAKIWISSPWRSRPTNSPRSPALAIRTDPARGPGARPLHQRHRCMVSIATGDVITCHVTSL